MNFNIKIFLLCPIPEDQKPIKQLINLKENSFTNILTLSNKEFIKKIFFNFFYYFLIISLLRLNELNYSLLNLNWFLISELHHNCTIKLLSYFLLHHSNN